MLKKLLALHFNYYAFSKYVENNTMAKFYSDFKMWISLDLTMWIWLLLMSAVGMILVHTTIPPLRQMFIKVCKILFCNMICLQDSG